MKVMANKVKCARVSLCVCVLVVLHGWLVCVRGWTFDGRRVRAGSGWTSMDVTRVCAVLCRVARWAAVVVVVE